VFRFQALLYARSYIADYAVRSLSEKLSICAALLRAGVSADASHSLHTALEHERAAGDWAQPRGRSSVCRVEGNQTARSARPESAVPQPAAAQSTARAAVRRYRHSGIARKLE